jgi:hypothetical protein
VAVGRLVTNWLWATFRIERCGAAMRFLRADAPIFGSSQEKPKPARSKGIVPAHSTPMSRPDRSIHDASAFHPGIWQELRRMVILARDFRQVGSPPNPRRAFFVNRAAGGAKSRNARLS